MVTENRVAGVDISHYKQLLGIQQQPVMQSLPLSVVIAVLR